MSISTVNADTSAVWNIYRHPSPPSEPRDFSQFEAGSTGSDASGNASTTTSASAGKDKVGTDLHALLLDLQANGTKASGINEATTTKSDASGTSATGSSNAGTGNIASDLQTFFNDLQGAAGQGTNGIAAHHHHHHGSPPAPAQTTSNPTGNPTADPTATVADSGKQDGSSGLLGAFVKALQSYGASASSGQASSNVALSA